MFHLSGLIGSYIHGVLLTNSQPDVLNPLVFLCVCLLYYRAFSCDIMAAILVFKNKLKAAILVYQTSPLGIELYFYAKIVFCLSKPIWRLVT